MLYWDCYERPAAMNVAVEPQPPKAFPRRAFTVDDISRMIEAGIISEDEKFELIERGSRDDGVQGNRA
jgi:hypothetical protein